VECPHARGFGCVMGRFFEAVLRSLAAFLVTPLLFLAALAIAYWIPAPRQAAIIVRLPGESGAQCQIGHRSRWWVVADAMAGVLTVAALDLLVDAF
jgi:hypothetical protein